MATDSDEMIQGTELDGAAEEDRVHERQEWFLRTRGAGLGETPRGTFSRAVRRRRELEKDAGIFLVTPGLGAAHWTPIGPSVVAGKLVVESGRITCIAVG